MSCCSRLMRIPTAGKPFWRRARVGVGDSARELSSAPPPGQGRLRRLSWLALVLVPVLAGAEGESDPVPASDSVPDCSRPVVAGAGQAEPAILEEQDIVTHTRHYISVIQRKIQDNWLIPEKNISNFECTVYVRQRPDGCVLHASVISCGSEFKLIRSVLSAIRRSSPLPLPEYTQVFDQELVLTFRVD